MDTAAPSDMGIGIGTNMGIHIHTAAAGSVVATAVAIGRNRTVCVHQEVRRRGSRVRAPLSCRPIWQCRPASPSVSPWRPVSNHIRSSCVEVFVKVDEEFR